MINEKKVMENKVLILSLLSIITGILFGAGVCFSTITVVTKDFSGLAMVGWLLILVSFVLAFFADKSQTQIRRFINKPYVDDSEEN